MPALQQPLQVAALQVMPGPPAPEPPPTPVEPPPVALPPPAAEPPPVAAPPPLPFEAMHAPTEHIWVTPQPTQALPWLPHAAEVLPGRHAPSLEQQPAHEATEHRGGGEPQANPTTAPTASAAANHTIFVMKDSSGFERPTLFACGLRVDRRSDRRAGRRSLR